MRAPCTTPTRVARTLAAGTSRRAGFTLVEVVVVLLIIAVATAFTLPALLEPRDEDDMTMAARRIDALFRLARDSAVRGGVPLAVAIDSATAAVWLIPERFELPVEPPDATGRTPPPRESAAARRRAAAAVGESLELPSSVRLELSRARARFLFTPGGASFGDTLVLRTSTRALVITVDPWSGSAIAH